MRFRNLVPALACLAAIPTAFAAETPAVKVDGFVDTFLSTASRDSDVPGLSNSNTAFSYDAKLGAAITISDKVAGQVDLFFNGQQDTSTANSSQINVRQAYGTWKIDPENSLTLKTGKFISDYGWVAYYAPEMYRVNPGPITALYGADQIGANLSYTKELTKGALTAALTVANGFFGEATEELAQSGSGQGNEKFAYGLDVGYAFPDKKGAVDMELVYDTDVNPSGGDGIHFGLNGKFTPNPILTVAAEFIVQSIGAADDSGLEDIRNIGLMGMGNYKLNNSMSTTGMVQYVNVSNQGGVDGADVSELELSLALLTTPAGTDKLGLNFEISYSHVQSEVGAATAKANTFGASVELLYIIP